MYLINDAAESRELDILDQLAPEPVGNPYAGLMITPPPPCRPALVIAARDLITPPPRSEWKDRLAALRGNTLGALSRRALPVHDQGRRLNCWAHGAVRALELLRIREGNAPLLLSAERVSALVTGGRDRGGWPEEALQHLAEYGTCAQNLWPLFNISPKTRTPENDDNARRHRIVAWAHAETFDEQAAFALMAIPGEIGLLWWRHAVCQTDLVQLGPNEWGLEIDNSHGPSYGDNGRAVLDEKHATADLGCFFPLSSTFFHDMAQAHG